MSEKMKKKPDFLNLRWSEADDQMLKDLITRGADGNSIARALGRTRASIFNRKHQLGIEGKIKRTPKGKADPISFGTKSKSNEPKFTIEFTQQETPAKPVKVKKTPKTKTKQFAENKVERGRLSQSAKLAQINRRLRRGDVSKVSEKTGFTNGFVSAVLSGSCPNERVINVAYNMVRGRKTNEQMMKK
jgi:hypothetical protein